MERELIKDTQKTYNFEKWVRLTKCLEVNSWMINYLKEQGHDYH